MAQKDIQVVLETQHRLEKSLLERMDAFTETLNKAVTGKDKDSMAKIRADFSFFKDVVFGTLNMLRDQIAALHKSVDAIEMRQRRKCLIFNGLAEAGTNENTQQMVLNIVNQQLELKDVSASTIKTCHRLGGLRQDGPRPILVRFSDLSTKSTVWKSKTKLRGTKVSLAEFLTHSRQHIFVKARKHFGIRQVWSMEGNINVKLPSGEKRIINSLCDFDEVIKRFPSPVEQPRNPNNAGGAPK
ncbi:hypothetical protein NE865_16255 [Phthorimaea operculella]|nr:hypothetical protein NE865_16255 [Phthorimaea operculella]